MGEFNSFSDNLVEHLNRFIGETVTIFTTSGGESGSGFTGVILFVGPCFVRLVTSIGAAPTNPIDDYGVGPFSGGSYGRCRGRGYGRFGSVTDIPIDRIAAFVHNAV